MKKDKYFEIVNLYKKENNLSRLVWRIIKAETEENTEANINLYLSFEQIENKGVAGPDKSSAIKNKKLLLYRMIRIIFSISFVVFTLLFINEILIQPYRSRRAIDKIDKLYQTPEETLSTETLSKATPAPVPSVTQVPQSEDTETAIHKDPKRDDQGRLLQFQDLLAINEDVKGWITIPDSNIDYVVVQPGSGDPEYYLHKNIFKEDDKAGTLFLDKHSSVESKTQNLVIHGHNMTSTDNMFHYLMKYKELDYYKARPVFTFDTIYETGKWKIFAVFITNGTTKKEPLFDYTRTDFKDSSDFLNFVYQLRIRSMYNMDTVDVNENDQLLMLSTCSYEVKDYRTVIVARKVREGEDPVVNVDSVTINQAPLYPYTYYYRYGGKAPELTPTFEEALAKGEVKWYK
jgi:sortase B